MVIKNNNRLNIKSILKNNNSKKKNNSVSFHKSVKKHDGVPTMILFNTLISNNFYNNYNINYLEHKKICNKLLNRFSLKIFLDIRKLFIKLIFLLEKKGILKKKILVSNRQSIILGQEHINYLKKTLYYIINKIIILKSIGR